MKYRKKPVIAKDDGSIGVVQYVGGADNIIHIIKNLNLPKTKYDVIHGKLRIHTTEQEYTVNTGDWIVKGIGGEICIIKPGTFEKNYEVMVES